MDPRASFDRLVASITFTGSLLSFLATTAVLICSIIYRREQRSFRHALIFNLALAEFINTLNNTISGAIYLHDRVLWPGTACTINGFIGQLSVQAADFSILVIAVVTVLTITRTTYMPAASTWRKCAICGSVWVVPLVTASVATGMGRMGPVSGNWCWILKEYTDLRYALTHGWRIAIIFCTAGIYIFVWWYMNRHFRSMVSTMTGVTTGNSAGSSIKENWQRRRRGFKKMKEGANPHTETQETELSTMSKSRISRVGGVDDWEMSAPEAAHVRSSAELWEVQVEDGEAKNNQTYQNDTRKGSVATARTRTTRKRSDSLLDSEASDNDDDIDDEEHARRLQYQQQHDFNFNSNNATRPNQHAHHNSASGTPAGAPQAGAPQGSEHPKSHFDSISTNATTASEFPKRRQTRKMEREIKRMLLLNAYPIMYVILWIPGLVNRFMEATGNTPSNKRVLAALQASSQFVGLANALTYGFNTALRTKVRRWWKEKRGGSSQAKQ